MPQAFDPEPTAWAEHVVRSVRILRRYEGEGTSVRSPRTAPPWPSVSWGEPLRGDHRSASDAPSPGQPLGGAPSFDEAVWLTLPSFATVPEPVELATSLPAPEIVGRRWLFVAVPLAEQRSLLRWLSRARVDVPRSVRGSALLLRGYRHLGGLTTAVWDVAWGAGRG